MNNRISVTWEEIVKGLEVGDTTKHPLHRLGLYFLSRCLSKQGAIDALMVGTEYSERHLRRLRKELADYYDRNNTQTLEYKRSASR